MNDQNTTTIEPVKPGNFNGSLPEWGRCGDVQRIFGIGRATTYLLLKAGKIRGCVLRARGKKSGLRLIDMQSVREYIKSEMARTGAISQEAA